MCRSVREFGVSALLVALTLGVDAGAQDKKPESTPASTPAPAAAPAPAAGQQQDRIDIGPLLDSWYKVFQKDEAVGYVHEVLQRAQAGTGWRYTYNSDAEVELMVPDPKDARKTTARTESLRVSSRLDDTYAPVTMERTDNRDGADVISQVTSEESGRKIEIILGTTDRRSYPVSNEEEVHYSRFLMFISLRQNGKLSKPGTQRAMLFAPREDDKAPPLAEVQLEVHEVLKREYMGKKDVSVTRVSYLKPPPAPTRDAELMETYVDKFGRIVEETTRGGLKRILVKDEIEAVGRNERVRQGARHDPFRKDLAMAYAPKKGDKEDKIPEVVNTGDMTAVFKKIEDLIEDLRKAKEEKRDEEGQKAYDKLLDIQTQVRKANLVTPLPPDQLARMETLRKQAEEVWGGVARLMKSLQGTYVKVIEAYNRDEVDQMEAGIAEFKKAQTRKELEDQPELSQVLKWIGELEPLVGKCRTRIELGRKKIVLTGTLLHEDSQLLPVDVSVNVFGHQIGGVQEVRFMKPNRIAVINDKMYRVGDVVEGEGVRIEKVWAFGVQVSLREEVRDVGIRQK